jgi:NAD(P)-dependent dehydrogenase (short-subunit alcohol dehydrogenase family)
MLPLDVTSDESVEAAERELIRLEGRIDLLVNNAGFGVAPAGAEESSIEQAKAIFETNFFGLVRMTRAVVPHMRRQGSRPRHQHRLGTRFPSDALRGALFRDKARG